MRTHKKIAGALLLAALLFVFTGNEGWAAICLAVALAVYLDGYRL